MLAWLAGLALASSASWWIWREQPFPDEARLFIATLAPVVLWALLPVVFARWMFAGGSGRTETPKLRDQKRMVLRFLADRGLKGSRRRHALPLYLVAGPPGTGKSSLIEQTETGLGMPASIGDSRWWVGQDAIFVEASIGGAEGVQDVFDLIRGVRPRQPLNATLLVVSPPDLALADETELQMTAEAIAADLRLLEERVGMSAPVYLFLAKTDMVPGFREFFDRLEPHDREAAWGFSLPLPADQPTAEQAAAEYEKGLDRMLSGMRARHIEWLSREVDPVRSGRIHGFSTQGAALSRQIRPILDALAPKPAQEWQGVALRGVFLTSARQEPLTIDALLPDLSQRFALPRIGTLPPDLGMEDENHGYFIAGAIRKAVLPEAGLATRQSGISGLVQWALIALAVAGTIGAGWYIWRGFDQEVRLAARLSQTTAEFGSVSSPSSIDRLGEVVAALRRFDALAAEAGAMAETALPPPMTGRKRYVAAASEARSAYLRNVLLPHLTALLETQLADVQRADGELSELIAVSQAAGDPDSDELRRWLEANAALVAEEDRERFVGEGIESIRAGGGLDIDPAYIDAARRMIAYRESLS